jgi:2-keto-4-pentenoate hydratase/2-oxohepta-3-ene-1,7-dioic acid hydratase in catechol pathway
MSFWLPRTGTPSGVGPTEPGDELTAGLETVEEGGKQGSVLAELKFAVEQRSGGYHFKP